MNMRECFEESNLNLTRVRHRPPLVLHLGERKVVAAQEDVVIEEA